MLEKNRLAIQFAVERTVMNGGRMWKKETGDWSINEKIDCGAKFRVELWWIGWQVDDEGQYRDDDVEWEGEAVGWTVENELGGGAWWRLVENNNPW